MGALMDPAEWNINSLGTVPASVEIKLVDFPDAGYFTTNEPEQGEIWIRGDAVATSYFNNEAESKEAFEDGWFKTGDIGEWDKNGHLKIIDRKKNLVKTSNGEYIALEKVGFWLLGTARVSSDADLVFFSWNLSTALARWWPISVSMQTRTRQSRSLSLFLLRAHSRSWLLRPVLRAGLRSLFIMIRLGQLF